MPDKNNSISCDVLVCGAGPAGFCAAIAAARNGADTVILDKETGPGGAIVWSLVTPLMTFHAASGQQVIKGIAEELVNDTVKAGGSPGHIPDPLGVAATITPVDPDIFGACVLKRLKEAGVKTMFGGEASGVIMAGDTITGAAVKNEPGGALISAKVVVDATGDAEIARMCGAAFTHGRPRDGKTQPMTLMFIMDGISGAKVREYIKANPGEFVLSAAARKDIDSLPLIAVSGFFSLVRKAQQDEKLILFRDRVLYFELPRAGQAAVNMTRVLNLSGTDPLQRAYAAEIGRRQMDEAVIFLKKYVPGFERSFLSRAASRIGVRETRHIAGRSTLTEEDVLTGRVFEDSIARGAFPIDIHSPDGAGLDIREMKPGAAYGIPYGCMLPEKIEGLLVAGRAISATHEANASARLSPTCMALGQAAGTAAALCVKTGAMPSKADVAELRRILTSQNAVI